MSDFLYQGLIGVSLAMILWLVAAGFTIAFGVCKILNVAHGSLCMLGSYFAFTFYQLWGLNFWISVTIAIIGVGFVGFLMEFFFLRRTYEVPLEFQLILTFAFIYIFEGITKAGWGTTLLIGNVPTYFAGTVSLFARPFPIYNLFVIGAGIIVTVGLWLVLNRTWWGKKMVVSASNKEMASALGVNTRTLFTQAFIFAAMLAAVAGALTIPVRVCSPGVGGLLIIEIFIITVIGGLGNLKGAFVAALIVGVVGAFIALYLPELELFVLYGIMALVLLIRPQGILRGEL